MECCRNSSVKLSESKSTEIIIPVELKWMGETSSSRTCIDKTPLFMMTQIAEGEKKQQKKPLAKLKSESESRQ